MTNNKQQEKSETDKEPFVRWQALTLEQMGATTNMLLGLSTGLLALLFTFMLNDTKPLVAPVTSLKLALWSLALSIGAAVLSSMTRLHDFRGTRNIASGKLSQEDKQATRRCVSWLGVLTWWLLTLQLGAFAVGAGVSTVMIFNAWHPVTEQGQKSPK